MNNRKVIITGVSSFVGMHLAKSFAKKGWDVCAVTSRPIESYDGIRAQRLEQINDVVTLVHCDLMDGDAVSSLIAKQQPNIWIHHAAYAENYASHDYDLEKSLGMNVFALEAIYENLAGTNCGVIVTGSSLEYSTSDEANKEDDVCWPEMPYGVSKLAESIECHRLSIRYQVATRIARLYIPVGTFDAPGKLIGSVINALLKGEAIDLSPCTQKRDFIGVGDIASAYLTLAEDMPRQLFDLFNICSGDARQLRELLEKICNVIGANPELMKFGAKEMRSGEAMVFFGNNNKAKDILQWQPSPINNTLENLVKEFSQYK